MRGRYEGPRSDRVPSSLFRPLIAAALLAVLLDTGTAQRVARGDEEFPPSGLASAAPAPEDSALLHGRPFPPRGAALRRGGGVERAEATGTWWLGTAGIALALAVCGAISLATRRGGRGLWAQVHGGGVLRVVGRTRISPRHTVHLLSIGDRVLILGTGPQGAPTLLGELSDPASLQRLAPQQDEDPPVGVGVGVGASVNVPGDAHSLRSGPVSGAPSRKVVYGRRPPGDER